jgi:hypothetical protein
MYVTADKTQGNTSRSVANELAGKRKGAKAVSKVADHQPGGAQPGQALLIQRVKIIVAAYSKDQEDTEDIKAMLSILELVDSKDVNLSEGNKKDIWEEYKKGTYKSSPALEKLVEKHCGKGDSKAFKIDEEAIRREDATAWRRHIGTTVAEQLQFLQSVVDETRRIVPVAINRNEERPAKDAKADLVNNMFQCQQELVKNFAAFMGAKGLRTDSNYIHPAALERIMLLVKGAAMELAASSGGKIRVEDIKMAGLCKDYASIVYGLIKQNDPGNIYNARLGFVKDHVFVEVNVGGNPYVIDAWRTGGRQNDGVVPKSMHLANLNHPARGGATFADLDEGISTQKEAIRNNPKKNESLDAQYADYGRVYALLKEKEADYKKFAREFLARNEDAYVGTGKF